MSDLISRSELLKEIEKYKFGAISNDIEREYIKNTILDFINFQPTAYDIDKVVEELEIRVNEANNNCLCEMHENGHTLDFENENGRIKGLKEAIEIVKQGDVSDDVCEWKLEDEEANLYLTGCQQRQLIFEGTPKENGYRYCPYCGKKIKIVGD